MTQERVTHSGGGQRRRRRGGRRHSSGSSQNQGPRNHDAKPEAAPAKGIVGFFKKLFGIKDKPAARSHSHAPAERRERFEKPTPSERSERPAPTTPREPKPERKADVAPEQIEVTTPKLYVGNLSYDSSESDIFDLFSKAGTVKNVEIVRDRNSNSKGFGFVEMNTLEGAKDAAEKYHRFEFMDRQLIVNGARR